MNQNWITRERMAHVKKSDITSFRLIGGFVMYDKGKQTKKIDIQLSEETEDFLQSYIGGATLGYKELTDQIIKELEPFKQKRPIKIFKGIEEVQIKHESKEQPPYHKGQIISSNFLHLTSWSKNILTYEEVKKLWKGTKAIDDNKYISELLKTNCTEFDPAKNLIFRSFENNNKSIIIDPKVKRRISRSNPNYYTLIIDNSKYWSEYPKRGFSLISSLNKPLWNENLYLVIPYDGAKWGVSQASDFWYSIRFKELDNCDLLEWVNILGYIHGNLYDEIKIPSNSWSQFKYHIDKIEKTIRSMSQEEIDDYKNLFENYKEPIIMIDQILKGVNIIEWSEERMKPEDNNIQLMTTPELQDALKNDKIEVNVNESYEVWTDSKCVMLKLFSHVNYDPSTGQRGVDFNLSNISEIITSAYGETKCHLLIDEIKHKTKTK